MQRGVLQALNLLYNRVTFTAIVPGAYPRRPKWAKNVLKWRIIELTGWITGKRLEIDGYMLRCVWQALIPLFIHVTFTAIVPGTYPGRPKCALDSLSVAKCFHPQNGWGNDIPAWLFWGSQILPRSDRARRRASTRPITNVKDRQPRQTTSVLMTSLTSMTSLAEVLYGEAAYL